MSQTDLRMQARDVNVFYGDDHALRGVSLDVPNRHVTALIGPSGCGKSTFLRCLNRMNETIEIARVEGSILLEGEDIYGEDIDANLLRQRVGMVFQKPNPFPKSIYDNVAYGPRLHGMARTTEELNHRRGRVARSRPVGRSARPDRLRGAGALGGQQQRLCIARAIAVSPEVILMDEPCSALDPIATSIIEELILELARDYAIVIVTHNTQQAQRVAGTTAFFHLGDLVEVQPTDKLFNKPKTSAPRTMAGSFGKPATSVMQVRTMSDSFEALPCPTPWPRNHCWC